jgi:glycosyltransferase involved in cell wall biosynthesis
MILAIIIPYYKLTFFEETLESLANQTNKRFRVYIGDDNSLESPVELLKKYNEKIDFVYHRFEQNLGGISLTQQWDRCIALSDNEDWIMILGDDDYLDSTVIECWYRYYNEFLGKSSVVRFATKIVLEDSKTISEIYTHPIFESPAASFVKIFKGQTRSSLSEYVFLKTAYEKHGFKNYPLGWCSDYKAFLDFSDKKLIYSINDAAVFFRISNLNISGQQNNAVLKKDTNIHFFKDVILNNTSLFEKEQRLELIMAYEIAIKNSRKPTILEWLFVIKFYLINFKFLSFAKCIRRFFISTFKF